MGLSYGFSGPTSRFHALNSTDDGNRNYYYGLESFFYRRRGRRARYDRASWRHSWADHDTTGEISTWPINW